MTEAVYNLRLARKLLSAIRMSELPFDPILLRASDDATLTLRERGEKSKAVQADLVISIHVNAHTLNTIHGGLIFCPVDCEISKAVGDAMARCLPLPLHRRAPLAIETTDHPSPEDNWLERPKAVLEVHDCPAVLLECGYMSNLNDAQALCSKPVIAGLVLAMEAGLIEFWRNVTRKSPQTLW